MEQKIERVKNAKGFIEDVPLFEVGIGNKSKVSAPAMRAADIFVMDRMRLTELLTMKKSQHYVVDANDLRDREKLSETATGTAYALNKRFHAGGLPLFARGLSGTTRLSIINTGIFKDYLYKGKYQRATIKMVNAMKEWMSLNGLINGQPLLTDSNVDIESEVINAEYRVVKPGAVWKKEINRDGVAVEA